MQVKKHDTGGTSYKKNFQTYTALNQISVSVTAGLGIGLVGSNGAGKSTLLRTIAGIYKPDSGTVAIDGTPIFEHPNVKNDIFFISDFPYFIPQSNMKEMAKFYDFYVFQLES